MDIMRTVLFLFSCFLAIAAQADSLDIARQLAQSGTKQLALERVLRDQPAKPDAAGWFEWESLRLSLLSDTRRHADLIARVKALPRTAPRELVQRAYGHAAWAHIELGEGAASRRYLAQLLWQFDLSPEDVQSARRLVVRSYLSEHRADEAYRAMLRYKQDYAPLIAPVADEFARGLLAEARNTEALTWLTELDRNGATALQLNLRANFITPEEATRQASAALQKTPDANDYGAILIEAAEALREPRLRIQALEQVVNGAASASRAAELWRAYFGEAEATANRVQLLKGDDTAWFDLALQSEVADPVSSRALYAYLAQHARAPDLRATARARLFRAWVSAQLDGVAVRLLGALPDGAKLPTAELEPLVSAAADGMPAAFARPLRYTAARYADEQGAFALAADSYAQVVLSGDYRESDALGAQALRLALLALDKAGLKDDGAAVLRHIANAREAAKQAEVAAQAAKPKRKKK